MSDLAVRFTKIADCKIEYTIISPNSIVGLIKQLIYGRRQLLFMHGINDPFQNHERMLHQMANRGYRVYAFNAPGHGHSGQVAKLSWDKLNEIALGLIHKFKLKELTVVGYSMGAGVIINLLSKGQKFAKVRLIAPYHPAVQLLSVDSIKGGIEFLKDIPRKRLLARKVDDDALSASIPYLITNYTPLFTKPLQAELSKADSDIQVLLFEKDELINLKIAKKYFSNLPHIRLNVLSDMTHQIYYVDDSIASEIVRSLNL